MKYLLCSKPVYFDLVSSALFAWRNARNLNLFPERKYLKDISESLPILGHFDSKTQKKYKVGTKYYTPQELGTVIFLAPYKEQFLLTSFIQDGKGASHASVQYFQNICY